MAEAEGKHVMIPTYRHTDDRVLISTTEFESTLEQIDDRTDCFVQPDCEENVCMFSFATIVYSIAVEKNRPLQNIVIWRAEGTRTNDNKGEQTSPIPRDVESHLHQVGIQTCTSESCLHDIWSRYDIVAVGGTFDRLHAGHRLLLTIAAWTAKQCLWVGVAGPKLLQHKKHVDLISPFEKRAEDVRCFVRQTKPSLEEIRIQELENAAGAAGEDPSIQALVISRETKRGALAVNEQRQQRGLKSVDLVVVDILFQSSTKLSSTALREAEFQEREKTYKEH